MKRWPTVDEPPLSGAEMGSKPFPAPCVARRLYGADGMWEDIVSRGGTEQQQAPADLDAKHTALNGTPPQVRKGAVPPQRFKR